MEQKKDGVPKFVPFILYGITAWLLIGIIVNTANGSWSMLIFLIPFAALMCLAIKRVLWSKGK
jgi:uncharacterized protein (DUF983 family)